MSIRSLYGLAAAGIVLCSCQSNTYQIDGYARSFAEGDTICLMKEGGAPIAISTVSNGKFSFYGEIQETGLYSVMAKKAPACQVSFFTHPAADTTAQKALANRVDSLHRRMSVCILNTAQRNKANPLGKYINENYKAPEFK